MKRYWWYHTDLAVFEAAAKIRETILPIFQKNMNAIRLSVAQTIRSHKNEGKQATWADTGIRFLEETSGTRIPAEDDTCFFDAIDQQVRNHHKACIKAIDGKVECWFEVILLPHPDGGTVFKVFSNTWEYSKSLWEEDWCRDYSYWDNNPKEEEDSEEDWDARQRFWKYAEEHNLTDTQYVSIVPPTWYESVTANMDALNEVCSIIGFDPMLPFKHSPGAVRNY